MLRGELAAYGLRATRRPQQGHPVSGVVIVTAEGKKSTAYIGFTERFVQDIGKELPQGVSAFSPAYVSITQWPSGGWKVYAQYLTGAGKVLLLEYNECPVWVKIRRKK